MYTQSPTHVLSRIGSFVIFPGILGRSEVQHASTPWGEPELHSHIPSSEPWSVAVPQISSGRSEFPCPRRVTGDVGGQVGSEEVEASSRVEGEARVRLPTSPFQ